MSGVIRKCLRVYFVWEKRLRLSSKVDECKPLPAPPCTADQGLTLVHFSAQRKRFL